MKKMGNGVSLCNHVGGLYEENLRLVLSKMCGQKFFIISVSEF